MEVFIYERIAEQLLEGVALHCKGEVSCIVLVAVTEPVNFIHIYLQGSHYFAVNC